MKEILYSNLMANAILQSNVTDEQIKSKLRNTTNEGEKQFLKFALNIKEKNE